jgi:hypothetical protein
MYGSRLVENLTVQVNTAKLLIKAAQRIGVSVHPKDI